MIHIYSDFIHVFIVIRGSSGIEHVVFRCSSTNDLYKVIHDISEYSFFQEVKYIYINNNKEELVNIWRSILEKFGYMDKKLANNITDLGFLSDLVSIYINVFKDLTNDLKIYCRKDL